MLENELQRREYAIHNASSYCLKAFKHLQSSIKKSDPPSELIPLLAIEDQNGRFRAWISNTGALKIDRSSLDFRLRDIIFLADNVVNLLDTLYSTLSDAVKLITQEELSQASVPEEYCHNDDESDSSSNSNESEEPSSPLPAVQQFYLLIVDVIDRLYRLSVLIRSPQLQNRSTKAENFVEKDEDGRDLTAEFEAYAIVRAKHQMRAWKNITSEMGLEKDDEDLAIRIGKANSRRRRQFMYDQRHRRKFVSIEKDAEEEEHNEESPQHIGPAENRSTLIPKSSEIPASIFKSFAGSAIAAILSETTATELGQKFEGISDNSSTASSSSTYSGYQMSHVSIPEAPEIEFGKGFQCPYCKLYDSSGKDGKIKRMEWEHAHQWCCNFEGHPLAMFSEENGFKDHLEKHHSDTFESHQLQTLADASKRPTLAVFSTCPFCGAAPEDLVKSDHDMSVNLDAHMISERANIKTRDSSRDDLNYSKSVPSTGYRHSKSDIFDIFDTEIDEIEPSPFVETYERSADVPFKDNTLLWQEVFAQMPKDQRDGDLKLDEFLVQPTSLTTPQALLLETNSSTSKGKGTDLSTEWSEWIWHDQGLYFYAHRTNSTGALEYDYKYPVLENQQSTNRPQIELADPAYVTSRMDSIDDHDHETTPKSALISPALANNYYKTPGRDYSVSTSLSNTDPSNVSWPARYSSTNDTLVSSNTSWAPSKNSALSEHSTIPDDLLPSNYSVLSKDLAPPFKSTVSRPQSMSTKTLLAPPNGMILSLSCEEPSNDKKVGGFDDQRTYQETLDERYKIHGGLAQDEFWKVGRVFMMQWTEPAGTYSDSTYPKMCAHREIARFVVLSKDYGHSVCCPIQTYSTLKSNLPAPDRHAIIYTSPIYPSEHYYETHDGSLIYENLVLDPIRVDSERDDVDSQLHPLSILNYSKVYIIEHYVLVLNIGMVASESINTFTQQSGWDNQKKSSG
ncbi:hypothetical protein BOTCAL_0257g00030 [Botryotinia calthae]|uniref:DUF6590 domain-containing protein n=1 Tax=Botryotinia calthae TaxID=38488 RepID=A0A4Y8CW95_9HELO|nr:hypothetical protein BOTCAL_0257g00030 [Botryotinia calthae]